MEIKLDEITKAILNDGNLVIYQEDNQEIILIGDDVKKLRDFLNNNLKD